jgi:ABC-type nitrate/sulfonate/bicarbonate transport system permease component
MSNLLRRLGGIVLLVAIWQAVVWSHTVPAEYFPSVATIAAAFWTLVNSEQFLVQIGTTWWHGLAGLTIGTLLALVLALLGCWKPLIRRMLDPLVEMLRALPPPAIVPLSIFALGLGPKLFMFIISFATLWPVYISAANALSGTEPVQIQVGRSLGYDFWEIVLRLRLPAAMPEIFTGIRLAAGISLLATVASEMLAGQTGLGFLLYQAAFSLDTATMFAVMVTIGISGLLLNLLVVWLGRQIAGWQVKLVATGEAH